MENRLSLDADGCNIELTEERGITVLQLHGVRAHVDAQSCKWVDNEMALEAERVNLYHVAENLIKPATAKRKCSFVELIAESAQIPRWFVSHWWGEPVREFIACVDAHAALRGVPKCAAYWVCAYANNQWALSHDVATNPAQTSFRKAMDLSEGTLSIIDAGALTFTRIWCGFEIATTVRSTKLYDIASIQCAVPVILADGLSCEDKSKGEQYGKDYQGGAQGYKTRREQNFPGHVVEKALKFRIEEGQASVPSDKVRILNSIVGASVSDLDRKPPKEHPSYVETNNALHGRFASALYRHALEQNWPTLQTGIQPALRKSTATSLALSFHECTQLCDSSMDELSQALPSRLQSLELDFTGCHSLSSPCLSGLRRLTCLTSLTLSFSRCWYLKDLSVLKDFAALVALSRISLDCSMCQRLKDLDGLVGLEGIAVLSHVSLDFSACANLGNGLIVFHIMDNLPALTSLLLDFSGSTIHLGDAIVQCSSKTLTDLRLNFSKCSCLNNLSALGLNGLTSLRCFCLEAEMCEALSDLSPLQDLVGMDTLTNLSLNFTGCSEVSKKIWKIDSIAKLRQVFPSLKVPQEAPKSACGSGLMASRSLLKSSDKEVMKSPAHLKSEETEIIVTLDPSQPLGFRLSPIGAIASVTPGSQAHKAGVIEGWRALVANGQPASNLAQVIEVAKREGAQLQLTFNANMRVQRGQIFVGNTAKASTKKEDRWDWVFYVKGDTKYIESVTLTLHPSFKNPVRKLAYPFEAKFTGWGTFAIDVSITWKGGGELRTVWELQFEADACKRFEVP